MIRTAPVPMMTPPTVARRYGVKAEKVIGWIRRGELRAIDVSTQAGVGRPRFRISPADLAVFENQRAAVATPKLSRRRRQQDPAVTQYF